MHELQVGGTVRRKGLGKFLLLLCEMVRPCSGLSPDCGLINRAKITLSDSPIAIGLAVFWAQNTARVHSCTLVYTRVHEPVRVAQSFHPSRSPRASPFTYVSRFLHPFPLPSSAAGGPRPPSGRSACRR